MSFQTPGLQGLGHTLNPKKEEGGSLAIVNCGSNIILLNSWTYIISGWSSMI
jgi:hypothetical protein